MILYLFFQSIALINNYMEYYLKIFLMNYNQAMNQFLLLVNDKLYILNYFPDFVVIKYFRRNYW